MSECTQCKSMQCSNDSLVHLYICVNVLCAKDALTVETQWLCHNSLWSEFFSDQQQQADMYSTWCCSFYQLPLASGLMCVIGWHTAIVQFHVLCLSFWNPARQIYSCICICNIVTLPFFPSSFPYPFVSLSSESTVRKKKNMISLLKVSSPDCYLVKYTNNRTLCTLINLFSHILTVFLRVLLLNCVFAHSNFPDIPSTTFYKWLSKINQQVSVPLVFVFFVLTLNIPVESRSQADRGKVWGSTLLAGLSWGRLCLQEACCRGDVKHTSSCLTSVSRTLWRPGHFPYSLARFCQFNCNLTPFSPPTKPKTFWWRACRWLSAQNN